VGAGNDERYLIYYAPVFAVGFAMALGARELRPALVVIVGVLAAVLLWHHTWEARYGLFSWFVSPAETVYANAFLRRLASDVPSGLDVRVVALMLELGVVAVCAVAVSGHRRARTLVALLVAGVVIAQIGQTSDALSKYVNGAGLRFAANAQQRSWIDKAIYGKSNAAIFASAQANTPAYDPIWEEVQFWNNSVRSVVTLGEHGIQIPTSDSWTHGSVDPDTGRVLGGPLAPYLVVPRGWMGVGLNAQTVAQSPYTAVDLVKLRSPNLVWTSNGVQDDGFMTPGQPVTIRLYRPALGAQRKNVCADVDVFAPLGFRGLHRIALADGALRRSVTVRETKPARVAVPLRHPERPFTDLTLTATGVTKLSDGRQVTVQISGVGVERCPAGVRP